MHQILIYRNLKNGWDNDFWSTNRNQSSFLLRLLFREFVTSFFKIANLDLRWWHIPGMCLSISAHQWFALLLLWFIMLWENLRQINVVSLISTERFLMIEYYGFIFFLLLNANRIPSIRNLQVLSQYIEITDKNLERLYLG